MERQASPGRLAAPGQVGTPERADDDAEDRLARAHQAPPGCPGSSATPAGLGCGAAARRWARAHLAGAERPRRWLVHPRPPTTPAGKVDPVALAHWAAAEVAR